jgi:peptidoglycan/LPS O-acetylase OafA/YrhL
VRPTFAERLLPNPGKNVPYLDAIRGIAVIFILLRHTWGLSGEPNYTILGHSLAPFIAMMSSGVDLFFVLSGVLLSARFLRADATGQPAPSFREYMKARILRIGPPYWVVLILVLVIYTPSMIPNDRIWSAHGAFMALTHLTFTQSLFMVSFGAYMVVAPFWTLTVEMVFYLILPVMVRAFYGFRWWQGVVASFAIAIAWLYACRYSMDGFVNLYRSHSFGLAYSEPGVRFFLSHQIIGYLPHFAIGCAISTILQRRPVNRFTSERAGMVYALIGVALLLTSMAVLGRLHVTQGFGNPEALLASDTRGALTYYFLESMPFAVSYGLIILGAALAPEAFRIRLSRIPSLTLFGVLGYSVYLIHMPLLMSLNQHAILADGNPFTHFPKMLALGTVVVLAFSAGLFMAVERPSLRWSAGVKKAHRPAVDPSGGVEPDVVQVNHGR